LLFGIATYSRVPSALSVTELGYQPVGICPMIWPDATSITPTAFSPASVVYKTVPFALRAREFGLEPRYA